jgi:hypothetical protein
MNRTLDSGTSFESLRNQAKAWLKALRGGDAALPDTRPTPVCATSDLLLRSAWQGDPGCRSL